MPERFGISDGRNSRSARDEVKVLDLTCFLLYNYYVRIAVEIYISVPGFSRSQFKSERGNAFRSRKPLIGLQQFNRLLTMFAKQSDFAAVTVEFKSKDLSDAIEPNHAGIITPKRP